ncbi:MAG TPA: PQQ-binding-like beta-propeller repeat protein [Actinomycetes bacterium]|nr:PQQ-binding-like beta-propeller repeat protein [Actinomycetes bacterium]
MLALGACAQAPGTRSGAAREGSSAEAVRDGRADPDGRGARVPELPGRVGGVGGHTCDTSAPPRRAAIIAYDGAGRQRWSVPLPVGSQLDSNIGPLVDGDTVYATEGDQLRALAAADGSQRWRLDLGGSVYDASLRDGVIVVRVGPLEAGHLAGVDAASGRELWRHTPPRGAWLSWQQLGTDDGGVVVTGERGSLVALERRDGTVRWTRPAGERSTPRIFATAGNRVLWIDRGALEAYDAARGRLLWRTAGVVRTGETSVELTVAGGVVVVGLGLDPSYRPVTAYDLATGIQRWRLDPADEAGVIGAGPAGIAVTLRTRPQGSDELELVDAATGAVRWRQRLTGWIGRGMIDYPDRQALVTSDEVVVVELGSDRVVGRRAWDGAVRWRAAMPGGGGWPQWGAGGRLLIAFSQERSGKSGSFLAAIDTGSGQSIWRGALPMVSDRPATPLGDGAVIQVHDPQRACALNGRAGAPQRDAPAAGAP